MNYVSKTLTELTDFCRRGGLAKRIKTTVLTGLFLASASNGMARDYWVDTPADVSELDGKTSLREAVSRAGSSDRILIRSNLLNVALASELKINNKKLRIIGTSGAKTMIRRTVGRDGRCVSLSNNAEVTFENLKFAGSEDTSGGAIFSNRSKLTLKRCDFLGNRATASGGAVYVLHGSAWIEECRFEDNLSKQGGAALRGYYAKLEIRGGRFEGNSSGSYGGAVQVAYGSVGVTPDRFGDPTVFKYNQCQRRNGGAMSVYKVTEVYVSGAQFAGNRAAELGGAMWVAHSRGGIKDTIFRASNISSADGDCPVYEESCEIWKENNLTETYNDSNHRFSDYMYDPRWIMMIDVYTPLGPAKELARFIVERHRAENRAEDLSVGVGLTATAGAAAQAFGGMGSYASYDSKTGRITEGYYSTAGVGMSDQLGVSGDFSITVIHGNESVFFGPSISIGVGIGPPILEVVSVGADLILSDPNLLGFIEENQCEVMMMASQGKLEEFLTQNGPNLQSEIMQLIPKPIGWSVSIGAGIDFGDALIPVVDVHAQNSNTFKVN